MSEKPNCYKCKHRRALLGSCHSGCANTGASVVGNAHGIRNGWFAWPYDFDPVWLDACDGFEPKANVTTKGENANA